jgi:phosphoribosylformimino-5-aminoimidazole carboxamide ribotide isomerase
MQVIGVLDLLGGRAVHARAGRRELYQPVRSVAGLTIQDGDAIALARAYLEDLEITALYAADLDAILNQIPAAPTRINPNEGVVRNLVALGAPVWLDAAIRSPEDGLRTLALGIARLVVGLETLPSYEVLQNTCASLGSECVVFSLDLSNGVPMTSPKSEISTLDVGVWQSDWVQNVAARVVDAGVGAMIVLDISRVGTRVGPDLDLIGKVRKAVPQLTLIAGGGIRGPEDLSRLADVGCDAALVATALLDGHLNAADVVAARKAYNPTR